MRALHSNDGCLYRQSDDLRHPGRSGARVLRGAGRGVGGNGLREESPVLSKFWSEVNAISL
jgi:hypothetical protein